VRLQEEGWQEPYDGRLSRTDLWEAEGEVPSAHPTQVFREGLNFVDYPLLSMILIHCKFH
jgi:hypothetical protein